MSEEYFKPKPGQKVKFTHCNLLESWKGRIFEVIDETADPSTYGVVLNQATIDNFYGEFPLDKLNSDIFYYKIPQDLQREIGGLLIGSSWVYPVGQGAELVKDDFDDFDGFNNPVGWEERLRQKQNALWRAKLL